MVATDHPERARPERVAAELRWLTIAEALRLTTEDNVTETIVRAAALFDE